MWTLAINLMSRLKLKHFLIIALIALTAFSMWAMGEIKFQKEEKLRQKDNYTNLRDLDSLKVAHLTFRNTQEIEDYVDSNKELSQMVDEQDLKIRKLRTLVFQKQTYIDNIPRETDVSSIVENIRNDVSSTAKWSDSTECLVIRGSVTYESDSLKVKVDQRKFDNSILISQSWKRLPKNFFQRILGLGRKVGTVKATSKCGESETLIIDKTKK